MTPLHFASISARKDKLKLLLRSNIDINAKDIYGETALHKAAVNGNIEFFLALIKAKANIHIKDTRGETVFHKAAANGNTEVFLMLIESEAASNLYLKNNLALTPIELALNNRHAEIVLAIFLSMNNDYFTDNIDDDKNRGLIYACQIGCPEIFKFIRESHFDDKILKKRPHKK